MTFSEALAKHPKAFDHLYTNMVRAGEVGGVLDVILQRLADFREKSQPPQEADHRRHDLPGRRHHRRRRHRLRAS